MGKQCCRFFSAVFDQILFTLAGNVDIRKSLDDRVTCPWASKNRRCHFFLAVFHPILFILTGNDDMHESSEEFEIQPDPIIDCRVSCPWASEKNPHRLLMGKTVLPLFSAVLDQILFKLAGNDDIHKSLDEFEISPDPTTDHRVSCPWASKTSMLPLFPGCYLFDPF